MPRAFNTTGPCNAEDHYMLPPEARLPDLEGLVEEKLYFVLHAARQTGKTTAMRAFAARMRARGYVAVWATLEESQGITEIAEAEPLWLNALASAAEDSLPEPLRPAAPAENSSVLIGGRLRIFLRAWSASVGGQEARTAILKHTSSLPQRTPSPQAPSPLPYSPSILPLPCPETQLAAWGAVRVWRPRERMRHDVRKESLDARPVPTLAHLALIPPTTQAREPHQGQNRMRSRSM